MGGKMPDGMNMEDLQKAMGSMGGQMSDQTSDSSPAVEEVD